MPSLPSEAEIAAAHAEGVADLAAHGYTRPDHRPAGFDPACHLCDTDRHVCPGCGAGVPHGTVACHTCSTPTPLFFNPDGTFKSVELAAFHAIHVQGGFTTPAREARRMLRDNASNGMALAWLAERGLSLHGEDEPPPDLRHGQVMVLDGGQATTSVAQPDVTPAEVATAQVLEDLAAPPAAVDLDQLADPAPLAWYTSIEGWDAEIAALEDQIVPLKEKRERASEIIQAAMGDAEEARIKGRPVVTWKTSKPAQRLDRKALEAAYGADVIAGFLVDNKAARPFKILPRRGGAR
jgi:hypothetical protein